MFEDPAWGPEVERRLRREAARIAHLPAFLRAPVMRRLLDFLVEETAAGRGDALKAYAVAVDGLGREADFDPQADSYPRVQVGRLRRMLDSAYGDGVPAEGRLDIPRGGYRVDLLVPDDAPAPAERDEEPPAEVAAPPRAPLRAILAVIVFAVLLAIALVWWRVARAPFGPPSLERAPVLELGTLTAPPSLAASAAEAEGVLSDGLRRTWLVRVRDAGGSQSERATYRLSGTVVPGPLPGLRLQLERVATGQLIWTGEAPLPPTSATNSGMALAPLLAELIQPYGLLATDQRAMLAGRLVTGHGCVLMVDRYRRERRTATYDAARRCTRDTLARTPLDANAQASLSMLTLDSMIYFDPTATARAEQASAAARRAIAIDPFNARGHFALSRAQLFAGACPLAVRAGLRAVTLNPLDTDALGVVGLILLNCEDPRAEALVHRAIALDPDAPALVNAALIYIAIGRDDAATALAAARGLTPQSGSTPALNDISIAAGLAAGGDLAGARAAWRRVEIASPTIARDPEALLRQRLVPPAIRAKMMTQLARAGFRRPAG